MTKENIEVEQVETIEPVNEPIEVSESEIEKSEDIQAYQSKIEALETQLESLKSLEKDNLSNSIKLELVKSGLSEDLFELVEADSVEKSKAKIAKLVELQKAKTIENSYQPSNHKVEDDYSKAVAKNDVQGMFKSKIKGLF